MNLKPNIQVGKAAIIVPIYYKLELYLIIQECLDSLKRYYPDFNLITIDDCSPEPIPPDWLITWQNEKNLGYTKTINRGLKFAFKKADIVIIANDDLEFKKGDLDKFRKIKDIGIYFPRDSASGALDTFGSIWGMNKATFQKLGLLNEKYKHFFSDRDYYQRALKFKIPIIKWDDICITHHESATYNILNKKELFKEDLERYQRNDK